MLLYDELIAFVNVSLHGESILFFMMGWFVVGIYIYTGLDKLSTLMLECLVIGNEKSNKSVRSHAVSGNS